MQQDPHVQSAFDLFCYVNRIITPHTFSPCFVLIAKPNNTRPPSVPGEFCEQRHAVHIFENRFRENKQLHKSQKTITVLYIISSKSSYLKQTVIHEAATPDAVRNNCYT